MDYLCTLSRSHLPILWSLWTSTFPVWFFACISYPWLEILWKKNVPSKRFRFGFRHDTIIIGRSGLSRMSQPQHVADRFRRSSLRRLGFSEQPSEDLEGVLSSATEGSFLCGTRGKPSETFDLGPDDCMIFFRRWFPIVHQFLLFVLSYLDKKKEVSWNSPHYLIYDL